MSTTGARGHLKGRHAIDAYEEEEPVAKRRQQLDLRKVLSQQQLRQHQDEDGRVKSDLKTAVQLAAVRQALLRMIIRHDLPLSVVEWPELHTFAYTLNYMANDCLWRSHQSVSRALRRTYEQQRLYVEHALQHAKTSIHLTTDTWHSPNFKELQAITAHFVDEHGKQQKALIGLPELDNGHAGVHVAKKIIETLEAYGIKEKLGYITADNHSANDTLCCALSEQLADWDAVEGRLRCFGHMVNLAAHAFFHAPNEEAVDYAVEQTQSQPEGSQDLDAELQSKEEGWLQKRPLQNVLGLARALRKSDRLCNAFKEAAGTVIRLPVDTRWNSYLTTFEDACRLRATFTQFVLDYEHLAGFELTAADWHLLEETVTFLTPFREATKACEGDSVTLDKAQLQMDSLSDHFKEQSALYRNNTDFNASVVTSWHAFDKYYTLIDQTSAYAAALLLHPERRKAYLQLAWHRHWVQPGIDRARALWLRYKVYEEVLQSDQTPGSYHERWLKKIAAKQRQKGHQD